MGKTCNIHRTQRHINLSRRKAIKKWRYKVVTIHGGKTVDERREAQWKFATPDAQILIATDAAGEGINLQFCRLLINWDIPWNPNRLEQRMGRIHRFGQKEDVLVFNVVASNTREGRVLETLLTKLDVIRDSMGDDRVYDVIQDVLQMSAWTRY
jgi:superfamily II DNA/RNA helicase